jgi:hypothetical protein
MAQVTITIPDAELPRVMEALCVTGNRAPVNAANAKQVVIDWATRVTREYEAARDRQAAVAAVPPPADPGIT